MTDIMNEIFTFMTTVAGVNTFTKLGDMIKKIAPLFSMGFALYIMLLSFYYYNKGIDESILDLSKKAIGWLLLIAFAFNADNYTYLASFIYKLPDEMIGWYSGEKFSPNLFSSSYENISNIIAAIIKLSGTFGMTQIDYKILALVSLVVVLICGVILVGISFFYYLLAKLILALVLMVGPFFIGAALFPATRQYFMNWVGQILNVAFTCLMYAVITMMQMDFVKDKLAGWGSTTISKVSVLLNIILSMVPITVLFVLLVWSVPSITSALTGGAGVDLHGRTLGRATQALKNLRKGGGRSGGSMRNGK